MSETTALSVDDEWHEWMEDTFNTTLAEEVGMPVPRDVDTRPLFRAAMREADASWTYDKVGGWLIDRYEETIDYAAKMVRGSTPAHRDAVKVVVALRAAWGIVDV